MNARRSFLVWVAAALIYTVFAAWYQNWRRPLSPAEAAEATARIASANPQIEAGEVMRLRAFLAADDGREFFMVNLVRIAPGKVKDPTTGVARPAPQILEGYTSMFIPALLARGGHPVIVARKVGPYIDAWGVEPDPGWTVFGYMRYRSRRDMAELAADPRFSGAHSFKMAAMPQTFSFPSDPTLLTMAGPRVWSG